MFVCGGFDINTFTQNNLFCFFIHTHLANLILALCRSVLCCRRGGLERMEHTHTHTHGREGGQSFFLPSKSSIVLP